MVAGVAALILSVNPDLSYTDVFDILTSTADEVGGFTYSSGKCDEMGYGRVNAFEALKAVYPISGPSFVCTYGTDFFIENPPDSAIIVWDKSPNIDWVSPQGSNPCAFSAIGYGDGWISATVNGVELPRVDVASEYMNVSGRYMEQGIDVWKTLYTANTISSNSEGLFTACLKVTP